MARKKKTKYKSKFEERTAEVLKGLCKYEPKKIGYIIKRNYVPDFVGKNKKNKSVEIIVEAKGFFRVGDTQKYTSIRDCLPKDKKLVFLLYRPTTKIRKGAKMTMAEWCEKEGLEWYTLDNIKDAFTK
jgi:hypothetical protein